MKKTIFYYIIIIFSVLVMLASWIFNIGWYRFALTFMLIPFIHTGVFLTINIISVKRAASFKHLERYIILSSVTYALSYLFLPDGGDYGEMYFFFRLIENTLIANIMMYISLALFAVNIVVLIFEGIKLRKCKI